MTQRLIYKLLVEAGETPESLCLFRLETQGRVLYKEKVPYPNSVLELYTAWQQHYLRAYRVGLRAKTVLAGILTDTPDQLRSQLAEAELRFMDSFQQWLRHPALDGIHDELAQVVQQRDLNPSPPNEGAVVVEVFLNCTAMELSRLPWEQWDLQRRLGVRGQIRLARMPETISTAATPLRLGFRRGKARILVILGDATGIDYEGDRRTLRSLAPMAMIEQIQRQPGEQVEDLIRSIQKALVDPQGWDLLFFAGHSNETAMTGGELGVAPGHSLKLQDIEPHLKQARANGLQFALFNSCSGLAIAQRLVEWGFNQVVVMREPVHNDVAQEFLRLFIRGLGQHRDAHDALEVTCHTLERDFKWDYPSAYLVPSIFRHPQAKLFQIQRVGPKQWLRSLKPNRCELLWVGMFAVMGLQSLPFVEGLLDQRMLVQAVYRELTKQLPPQPEIPPILIVEVDTDSLRKAGLETTERIDRQYVAKVIDQLARHNPGTIGIDYVFELRQKLGDPALERSVSEAFREHKVCFVLANTVDKENNWLKLPESLTDKKSTVQGDITSFQSPYYLNYSSNLQDARPAFGLLLANISQSRLQSTDSLTGDLPCGTQWPDSVREQPSVITRLSYHLGQLWLHPLVDYSIPPQWNYEVMPAWQVFKPNSGIKAFPNRTMILAPGYDDAGVDMRGEHTYSSTPKAILWGRQSHGATESRLKFTGAESMAYEFQSSLDRRLIIPIPDVWMVGVMALMGKSVVSWLRNRRLNKGYLVAWLGLGMGFYMVLSLQLYVAYRILVPIFLPLGTGGGLILFNLLRRRW
jgi:hypothetical protein